jgi:hypothetical protein
VRGKAFRAAGITGLALFSLATAPAHAASRSFVAVNQVQALPANAVAGQSYRLHGVVSNDGARAAKGRVTLRLLHRDRTPRVVGSLSVRVRAHGTRRFAVTVRVPALKRGSYQLAACAPRGIGGNLTCATGSSELQVAGGDAIRGPVAAAAAAVPAAAPADTCSSGKHSIAPLGDVAYPEGGNGGYKSVHTDTNLIYDAPSNRFLPGTHVDQTITATQCLTDFSFDFETQDPPNSNSDPTTPGPDMAVGSVLVNGQPATFTFVQPTYPGDPNGDNDPDPLAHRTGQANPINASNPNPPACASTGADAALQNLPCPANKLVITPSAPIPSGTTIKVTITYTGRPGVHSDGDGTTEGWFRSNSPANDGGFVTTEPLGTEDWMPLNDHPTGKPTYDFTTITNPDRTAISNGQLVSKTLNPPDANFPTAEANGNGSVTWKWHMPNPVQDYLVENSVGLYNNGYDDGVHGGVKIGADGTLFYEFQSAGVAANRVASNKAIMDMQEDISGFEGIFNGPFPFTTDGVIVGTPAASFEEEMETKITFAGGRVSLGTLYHENMHQWWGDNVAASLTRYTFLKEGMATLGGNLNTARTAATAAGGYGTPAGNAAFDASLISQFNSTYNSTGTFWTEVPSNPTPDSLFDNPPTYARPGASYEALRQILGDDRFITALRGTQHDFGGGNISEAQMEAQYHKYIPNQSAACSTKLDQFFTQWWDTAYPAGGGANRPQITGPGLAGPGFYDASGACSVQNPPVTTATVNGTLANGIYTGTNPTLTFSASNDGLGAGSTVYNLDGAGFKTYAGPIALTSGTHTVVFHSLDAQGNQEADQTLTFTVLVFPTPTSTVTGTVPATLSLTLGTPASFGAFTPGITKDYSATMTANTISSAGDAALSVADPSSTAPGHLVNGTFSLPSALQASATSPGGTGVAPAAVSGSPLTLETWANPISNDPVVLTFAQHIAANDALRTGSYSKTLTFTLSTTTP